MSVFDEWTCAFPGKMGLSWKRAWETVGTKEEAEELAKQNCNVVAIPVPLFNHIKEMERRVVVAEGKLREMGVRVNDIQDTSAVKTTPNTPPGWFAIINRQEGVVAFCGPPKGPGEVGKGGVVRIEDLPAIYLELLATLDKQVEEAELE